MVNSKGGGGGSSISTSGSSYTAIPVSQTLTPLTTATLINSNNKRIINSANLLPSSKYRLINGVNTPIIKLNSTA